MQPVHSDEIWTESKCRQQEETIVSQIYDHLTQLGFSIHKVISHTRSIWRRAHRAVVVSLVDDAWDCAEDRRQDTPYLFNSDTTVITDNWINTPTVYKVARLPDSFYGIYSYTPANQTWLPDRDFTFAVNRLDFKRMRVLSMLHQQLGLDNGYVNFNCQINLKLAHTDEQLRENFRQQFYHAYPLELPVLEYLCTMMPLKNYEKDFDEIHNHAWINIDVETYSSDNVSALSEKTFRCLTLPVPWAVYGGRYAVARLQAMGFDVMSDVVDHTRYDALLESQNKVHLFVEALADAVAHCKKQNFEQLQQRCKVAAEHNCQLLGSMKQNLVKDLPQWLVACV